MPPFPVTDQPFTGIPAMPNLKPIVRCLVILAPLLLGGCTSLLTNSIVAPTVDNLQRQTDLELVCQGAPAYLLMIDSMIAQQPTNRDLLKIGAQSYTGYATALTECGTDKKRLGAITAKGRLYGRQLLAKSLPLTADATDQQMTAGLADLGKGQVPALFWGSMAWLTWIQQQGGSAEALTDLVVLEKTMARLLELDEGYQAGSIHLFLGAYLAARPAMLGGDPPAGKEHFDRALAIAERRFLLIQVTYAETYARQVFDRRLHDALLQEVLQFDIGSAPEFALSNQIAKRKAERLLAEDFFAE